MKCLLISTFDTNGGAACSAFRLLKGLQANGVDAKMLVQFKSGDSQDVIAPVANLEKGLSLLRPMLDSLPLKYYRKREYTIFSPAVLPDSLATRVTSLILTLFIFIGWLEVFCG